MYLYILIRKTSNSLLAKTIMANQYLHKNSLLRYEKGNLSRWKGSFSLQVVKVLLAVGFKHVHRTAQKCSHSYTKNFQKLIKC